VFRLNRVTNTLVSPTKIPRYLARAPVYLAGSPVGIPRYLAGAHRVYRSLGMIPIAWLPKGPTPGEMTPLPLATIFHVYKAPTLHLFGN